MNMKRFRNFVGKTRQILFFSRYFFSHVRDVSEMLFELVRISGYPQIELFRYLKNNWKRFVGNDIKFVMKICSETDSSQDSAAKPNARLDVITTATNLSAFAAITSSWIGSWVSVNRLEVASNPTARSLSISKAIYGDRVAMTFPDSSNLKDNTCQASNEVDITRKR